MQEFELTTFLQTPGETAFVNLAVVSDLDKYLELREKLFAKLANSPYIKADMWAMFDQRCCTIRIPQMLKLGSYYIAHMSASSRISTSSTSGGRSPACRTTPAWSSSSTRPAAARTR